MADYSSYKIALGYTGDWSIEAHAHIDATESVATEVENARDGESNLLTKINLMDGVSANNLSTIDNHESRLGAVEVTLDGLGAYDVVGTAAVGAIDIAELSDATFLGVGTVVDAVIYDTSNDTDGGLWRNRCQSTSWFREVQDGGSYLGSMTTTARDLLSPAEGDLIYNTTTAQWEKYIADNTLYVGEHYGDTNDTWNATTRGIRQEFPAVVAVIADSVSIWVFDVTGSEPVLWMRFDTTVGWFATNRGLIVSAMNGEILMGGSGASIVRTYFIKDTRKIYYTTSVYQFNNPSIVDRGDTAYNTNAPSGGEALVNVVANDYAITVLPNSPIDPATQLPVPTIAVATDGGVSVIKDDGSVVDSAITTQILKVMFVDKLLYGAQTGTVNTWRCWGEASSIVEGFAVQTYLGTSTIPALMGRTEHLAPKVSGSDTTGGLAGLTHLKENTTTPAEGMVAYTTSDYCSGYMAGDIKGAWLADTDATNVTGTELVTNGTFDTDTSGWTAGDANTTLSIVSGKLRIAQNTLTNYGYAYQAIPVVAGQTYTLTGTVYAGDAGNGNLVAGTSIVGTQYGYAITNSTGTGSLTFTPSGNIVYVTAQIGVSTDNVYIEADNISVKLADADRSVNNNGLQVNGTITKTAVATGAELVAYSGFSETSYLQQPYNSDLDFGTGDFYVMGWVNPSSLTTLGYILDRNIGTTDFRFAVYLDTSGYLSLHQRSTSSTTATDTTALSVGVYSHFVGLRKSDGSSLIYINGILSSVNSGTVRDISDTAGTPTLTIGVSYNKGSALNGSLALWRIGAGAPTAEDIEYIYNAEKPLFQEGAKCTLEGASDAIVSMDWNEAKQNLYVTTSGGLSVFDGLQRVKSNTGADYQSAVIASEGEWEVMK